MNWRGVAAIYKSEMVRTLRTIVQSVVSPVITTSLYFIVFGSAIGSRITDIEGISYGSFLVPGLIMLTVLTNSVSNAAFGIFFPKFLGHIYELLSAPLSFLEIVLGFVGAAATKSIVLALIILVTANFFVDVRIEHPVWMVTFLVLTCVSSSLLGFIVGIVAKNFEQLNLVPMLVITPLVFLGGSFYSISMLPPLWQNISLLNPVLYLVSGFRWSFYGVGDVSVGVSLAVVLIFCVACLGMIWWIFKTGYRIKQ